MNIGILIDIILWLLCCIILCNLIREIYYEIKYRKYGKDKTDDGKTKNNKYNKWVEMREVLD